MPRDIRIQPNRGTTGSTQQPTIYFSGTTGATINLKVEDDGSIVFEGNNGGLFNITDSKDGLLSSVNDVSGLPIFSVFSTDKIIAGAYNQNALVVDTDKTFVGTNTISTLPTNTKFVVSGNSLFYGTITATTISATTYLNLPINVRVTGATYNNNTFTFTNNTGGTFNVLFNTVTGLTSSGTISSNTLSATTYQNLPIDIRVTGGTISYTGDSGSILFRNNTGGTFNVTGLINGTFTGGTVTGATNFTNGLTANTVSATTYFNLPIDTRVTGSSYSNNTFTFTNNTGGTFSSLFNTVTGLTVNGNLTITGTTSSNSISATTITSDIFNGNGSGLTNIPISGISNLQSNLNDKFDKTGGTVNGNVIVTGNVTILGTATTINTETLSVKDNVITLNSNYSAGTPFIGSSGIEVLRGSATTSTLLWDESKNYWVAGLTGDAKKIILYGDNVLFSSISGDSLTITGNTSLNGLTANTIYATNYLNLPTDITVTGGTYSADAATIIFTNNTGGTFNVTGITVNSGSFTGGTVTGATNFTGGISANTISASTYFNLPIDVYVTGGTYSADVSTIIFTNNTGGTFNVTGITVSNNNTFTGGTVTGATSFTNGLTADTISATTYFNLPIDVYVTGGTYSASVSTIIFTNNTGGTFNVTGITATGGGGVSGDYLPLSGGTVSGLTIFTSGLTVNSNLSVTGNTVVKGLSGTSAVISGSGQNILTVIGSGSSTSSPLFTIQGSSGELFSVSDSLTGSLFSVNDISGLPILEVFSDNTTLIGNYLAPSLNTTTKTTLISGTNNIYSIPTSAYTGAFFDYTLISTGSTGARAGTIMSIWSGSTAQYTDVSTNDIGNTGGVSFSVGVYGNYAILTSSATTSGWILKTIVRSI